jgi:hypothetical protein
MHRLKGKWRKPTKNEDDLEDLEPDEETGEFDDTL